MDSKCVELRVPAERSMLLIVRMTTSGIMSRAGMTLDEMDDMKMAIDESCNLMLLQKPACQMMVLTYTYDEDTVEVCVEGEGICAQTDEKDDGMMQEVIRCILESIVDEVDIVPRSDGGTHKIILRKKVPIDRRRSAV